MFLDFHVSGPYVLVLCSQDHILWGFHGPRVLLDVFRVLCSLISMFPVFLWPYVSVSKMFPRYPCSYPGCDVSQTPGFYSLASPEYYVPVVLWFWVLFDQDPYVPREHCSQELILWGSQGLVSGNPPPQDLFLSFVPIDRVLSFLSYVPRILTHSGFWNPNLPVALWPQNSVLKSPMFLRAEDIFSQNFCVLCS